MLSAQRTGNTMGAEIAGADLSKEISEATFAALLRMFLEHQVAAYADLPESMKQRLEGLTGIHLYGNRDDMDPASRTRAYPPDDRQKQVRGITHLRHPIVRRHPLTGRKSLYAVSGTSIGIEGMPEEEALNLLRELAAHSTQPKYQFSVRYGVGDVVIWDNAAVLHSATLVNPDDARTLWRITVKERERPAA